MRGATTGRRARRQHAHPATFRRDRLSFGSTVQRATAARSGRSRIRSRRERGGLAPGPALCGSSSAGARAAALGLAGPSTSTSRVEHGAHHVAVLAAGFDPRIDEAAPGTGSGMPARTAPARVSPPVDPETDPGAAPPGASNRGRSTAGGPPRSGPRGGRQALPGYRQRLGEARRRRTASRNSTR